MITTETVLCEAHLAAGEHIANPECIHPHGTRRHAQVKCADCDAPALRISAPEYSAGVDTTVKPRCRRHAHPGTLASYAPSAPVAATLQVAARMRKMHSDAHYLLSELVLADMIEQNVIARSAAEVDQWIAEDVADRIADLDS